jgi:hypothetical protein
VKAEEIKLRLKNGTQLVKEIEQFTKTVNILYSAGIIKVEEISPEEITKRVSDYISRKVEVEVKS